MPMRAKGSRSHYEHNYKNFGREVLQAPFIGAVMHAHATAVLAMAQQISPVATGEYLDSFEITDGIRRAGKRKTRRVYSRVTNHSDHAMAVEFGFDQTPRYRVLGRALGAVPGDQVSGA